MPETSKYDYPEDLAFHAGRIAALNDMPHNPRNSRHWKDGYSFGLSWRRGDFDVSDDSWVHDADMESR